MLYCQVKAARKAVNKIQKIADFRQAFACLLAPVKVIIPRIYRACLEGAPGYLSDASHEACNIF